MNLDWARNAIRNYVRELRAERGMECAINWFGRLALINFVGFCALAQYFGGDAMNGHEIDGRFFLRMGSRPPVEVSEDVFRFMYGYALVLMAHFAAAILIALARSRFAGDGKSPA